MLLALHKPEVSGTSVSLPVVLGFQGYLSKGVLAHLSSEPIELLA